MDYILYLYTLYKKKIKSHTWDTIHIFWYILSLFFKNQNDTYTYYFLYLYFSDNKTSRYLFFYRVYRYRLYIQTKYKYIDTKVKSLYPSLATNIAYVFRRPKYSRSTIPGAFNRSNNPDLILLYRYLEYHDRGIRHPDIGIWYIYIYLEKVSMDMSW